MIYQIYVRACYDALDGQNIGAGAYIMTVDGAIKDSNCFKVENSSNNAAALKAVIGALGQVPCESEVVFVTNMDYVGKAVMNTQARNANLELLAKSDKLIKDKALKVSFRRTDTPADEETYNMTCEMINDVVGYDINAKFSKFRKKNEPGKRAVPTIKANSLFTSIYGNKPSGRLNENEKTVLRGKLNTLIHDAQEILAML